MWNNLKIDQYSYLSAALGCEISPNTWIESTLWNNSIVFADFKFNLDWCLFIQKSKKTWWYLVLPYYRKIAKTSRTYIKMSTFQIRVIFEILLNSIVCFLQFSSGYIQVSVIIKVDLFSGFYGTTWALHFRSYS